MYVNRHSARTLTSVWFCCSLQRKEAALNETEHALADVRTRVWELENTLRTRTQEVQSEQEAQLRKEVQTLTAEVTQHKSANDRLTHEVTSLQTANHELATEKARTEDLKNQVDQLIERLAHQLANSEKSESAQVTDLTARVTELIGELRQAKETWKEKEQDAATASKELEACRVLLEQTRALLDTQVLTCATCSSICSLCGA